MRLDSQDHLIKKTDEKKQRFDRCSFAKNAANHCYKSLFLNLRNSLIYKGFSVMAER
jgi:hypothetical protein